LLSAENYFLFKVKKGSNLEVITKIHQIPCILREGGREREREREKGYTCKTVGEIYK